MKKSDIKSRRLQAQRKFAQGAYIPPNYAQRQQRSARPVAPSTSNDNIIFKNMSAHYLMDCVSFKDELSLHNNYKRPIVVLERLSGSKDKKNNGENTGRNTQVAQAQVSKNMDTSPKQKTQKKTTLRLRSLSSNKEKKQRLKDKQCVVSKKIVRQKRNRSERPYSTCSEDDKPLKFLKLALQPAAVETDKIRSKPERSPIHDCLPSPSQTRPPVVEVAKTRSSTGRIQTHESVSSPTPTRHPPNRDGNRKARLRSERSPVKERPSSPLPKTSPPNGDINRKAKLRSERSPKKERFSLPLATSSTATPNRDVNRKAKQRVDRAPMKESSFSQSKASSPAPNCDVKRKARLRSEQPLVEERSSSPLATFSRRTVARKMRTSPRVSQRPRPTVRSQIRDEYSSSRESSPQKQPMKSQRQVIRKLRSSPRAPQPLLPMLPTEPTPSTSYAEQFDGNSVLAIPTRPAGRPRKRRRTTRLQLQMSRATPDTTSTDEFDDPIILPKMTVPINAKSNGDDRMIESNIFSPLPSPTVTGEEQENVAMTGEEQENVAMTGEEQENVAMTGEEHENVAITVPINAESNRDDGMIEKHISPIPSPTMTGEEQENVAITVPINAVSNGDDGVIEKHISPIPSPTVTGEDQQNVAITVPINAKYNGDNGMIESNIFSSIPSPTMTGEKQENEAMTGEEQENVAMTGEEQENVAMTGEEQENIAITVLINAVSNGDDGVIEKHISPIPSPTMTGEDQENVAITVPINAKYNGDNGMIESNIFSSIPSPTMTGEKQENVAMTGEEQENVAMTGEEQENVAMTGEEQENVAMTGEEQENVAMTGEEQENVAMTGEEQENIAITDIKTIIKEDMEFEETPTNYPTSESSLLSGTQDELKDAAATPTPMPTPLPTPLPVFKAPFIPTRLATKRAEQLGAIAGDRSRDGHINKRINPKAGRTPNVGIDVNEWLQATNLQAYEVSESNTLAPSQKNKEIKNQVGTKRTTAVFNAKTTSIETKERKGLETACPAVALKTLSEMAKAPLYIKTRMCGNCKDCYRVTLAVQIAAMIELALPRTSDVYEFKDTDTPPPLCYSARKRNSKKLKEDTVDNTIFVDLFPENRQRVLKLTERIGKTKLLKVRMIPLSKVPPGLKLTVPNSEEKVNAIIKALNKNLELGGVESDSVHSDSSTSSITEERTRDIIARAARKAAELNSMDKELDFTIPSDASTMSLSTLSNEPQPSTSKGITAYAKSVYFNQIGVVNSTRRVETETQMSVGFEEENGKERDIRNTENDEPQSSTAGDEFTVAATQTSCFDETSDDRTSESELVFSPPRAHTRPLRRKVAETEALTQTTDRYTENDGSQPSTSMRSSPRRFIETPTSDTLELRFSDENSDDRNVEPLPIGRRKQRPYSRSFRSWRNNRRWGRGENRNDDTSSASERTLTDSPDCLDFWDWTVAPRPIIDDGTNLKAANVTTQIPITNGPSGPKVLEAPTFHLTEAEFNDPIAFFEKVMPAAAKHGLCKVVAPPSFKPRCEFSEEQKFNVSCQYIPRMYSRWGPGSRELSAIKACLATQQVKLPRAPLHYGMELNLPKLYLVVQRNGGLNAVNEKKRWNRVADEMRFPKAAKPEKKLDSHYLKCLVPYETLSNRERQSLMASVEKGWMKKNQHLLDWARNPLHRQKKMLGESESSGEDSETDPAVAAALIEAEDCVVRGRKMNFASFKKVANSAKATFFDHDPTPAEVEQEYWKLVLLGAEHVCVNAASIDTGHGGYGFQRNKNELLGRHPWNLKLVSCNTGNVLRSLGAVVGVTVPTLHLGMVFSTSCWHRDPHGLPWLEYLHEGSAKIWYGIPDEQSSNFRKAVESLCPTSCQNKSIWLPSDIAMIPPNLLREHNVSLSRVVQRPGEYIVVFPKAYSCSISTGLTVSESVYFATNSWLKSVHQVFQELRASCEPAMFSLEQLYVAIARDPRAPLSLLQIAHAGLTTAVREEHHNRRELRARRLPVQVCTQTKKRQASPWNVREQDECELCRATLYLSKVTGICGRNSSLCLQHALRLLETQKYSDVDPTQLELVEFYTEGELSEILASVARKLDPVKLEES